MLPPTSLEVTSTMGASAVTVSSSVEAAHLELDVHGRGLADLEPQVAARVLLEAGQLGGQLVDAGDHAGQEVRAVGSGGRLAEDAAFLVAHDDRRAGSAAPVSSITRPRISADPCCARSGAAATRQSRALPIRGWILLISLTSFGPLGPNRLSTPVGLAGCQESKQSAYRGHPTRKRLIYQVLPSSPMREQASAIHTDGLQEDARGLQGKVVLQPITTSAAPAAALGASRGCRTRKRFPSGLRS